MSISEARALRNSIADAKTSQDKLTAAINALPQAFRDTYAKGVSDGIAKDDGALQQHIADLTAELDDTKAAAIEAASYVNDRAKLDENQALALVSMGQQAAAGQDPLNAAGDPPAA